MVEQSGIEGSYLKSLFPGKSPVSGTELLPVPGSQMFAEHRREVPVIIGKLVHLSLATVPVLCGTILLAQAP